MSGRYAIASKGWFNTYGRLYDAQQKEITYDDASATDSSNFRIIQELEAGKTYYLEVFFDNEFEIGDGFDVDISWEGEAVCDHEWEYVNVISPTCTKDGSRTPRCKKCGLTEEPEKYGNATGHTEGAWKITKANTCTAVGERVKECTKCNTVLKLEDHYGFGT